MPGVLCCTASHFLAPCGAQLSKCSSSHLLEKLCLEPGETVYCETFKRESESRWCRGDQRGVARFADFESSRTGLYLGVNYSYSDPHRPTHHDASAGRT
jgi:hypothetical protein